MSEAVYADVHSSRVLAVDFDYLEPASKDETLRLLDSHKERGVAVLAGGTDLLVKIKAGAAAPACLLSIKHLAELAAVETDAAAGLTIGAAVPLLRLERHPAVRRDYPALWAAIAAMAGPAVRAMGTVGGNLCNASPAADTAPALVALGAAAVLESVAGRRTLPVAELFAGPGRTRLQPGELLTAITVPTPAADSGSAYTKVARVSGDIAKVNGAVYLERDGDGCGRCRIALGAVAPTVVRVAGAEAQVTGGHLTRERVRAAAAAAAAEIQPITDIRSTAAYRRHMAAVIVEELLLTAWSRSGGAPLK